MLRWQVESNEAESVCVSSMASIKPRNKPEAVQLDAHMGDLKSAIMALNKNVGTIIEFLGKVQSGAATAQPALMRSIQATALHMLTRGLNVAL